MEAPQAASQACLKMLMDSNVKLDSITHFAADVGPGSFTGTRVGVTLAKTFAYRYKKTCFAIDAFNLIDPERPVAIRNRVGEWFLRDPGQIAKLVTDYPEDAIQDCPHAQNFLRRYAMERAAMELVPEYLVEPSISVPKNPFVLSKGSHA
jgi:tRNA A37 threonylcarbamoyladenosine modification protein TsaB